MASNGIFSLEDGFERERFSVDSGRQRKVIS